MTARQTNGAKWGVGAIVAAIALLLGYASAFQPRAESDSKYATKEAVGFVAEKIDKLDRKVDALDAYLRGRK